MTIELLHGNGVLENPDIITQADIDEVEAIYDDPDDILDFGDIFDIIGTSSLWIHFCKWIISL